MRRKCNGRRSIIAVFVGLSFILVMTFNPQVLLSQPNQGFQKLNSRWIEVFDNLTLTIDTFTVECWFKGSNRVVIVSRDQAGNARPDWSLVFDYSNRRLEFMTGMNSQPDEYFWTPVNSFSSNAWHHIALFVNGNAGNVRVYIDGIQRLSANFPPRSFTVQTGLAWGGYYNNSSGSAGSGFLDECRYWSIERTPAQIIARKDMTLPLHDRSGLNGYWKFCGNFADSSGKGNHMSPRGNPQIVNIPDLPIDIGCEPPRSNERTIQASSLVFNVLCPKETPKDSVVVVRNTGSDTLTIKRASITGTHAQDFSLTNPISIPPELRIPPGVAIPITVRFSPTAAGLRTAQLILNSNATNDSALAVPLTGVKDSVGLRVNHIDIGRRNTTQFPFDTAVTIKNTGTVPLTISRIQLTTGTHVSPTLPVTVAPNDSVDVTLRFFGPTAMGVYRDTLMFVTTPSCDPLMSWIDGERVPSVFISAPRSVFFSFSACDLETRDTLITLFNPSDRDIRILNIAISPDSIFSISPTVSLPLIVPRGKSVTIGVRFAPSSFGVFYATLKFESDAPESSVITVSLSGTLARIFVAAQDLDFGGINPGMFPQTKQVRLTNASRDTIHVTSASLRGTPFTLISGVPVSIPPGGSALVTVRFNDPGAAGRYTDTLLFSYHPPCDPLRSIISGEKKGGPGITYPSAMDFNLGLCDRIPYDTVIVVRNPGIDDLILSNAAIIPDTDFKILSPTTFPITVPAGDSTQFVIRFNPATSGAKNAVLTFSSNAINGLTVSIPLSGRRNSAELTVAAVDFGTIQPNQFPVTRNLTIQNTGNVPITIDSLVFQRATPFAVLTSLPITLQPGAAANILVRFSSPPADGVYADTLRVIYRPDCGPLLIPVSGTSKPTPILSTIGQVDFGTSLCGYPVRDTVITIHNPGMRELVISSASITGSAEYSVLSTFPKHIPPGGSDTIRVRLSPVSPGMKTAQLTLISNAENGSITTITLNARIDLAELTVTAVDFGTVPPLGFPVEKTFTVRNTGTVPITVTGAVLRSGTTFTITSGVPVTIAPNSSAQITIRFNDPLADGKYVDTLDLDFVPKCSRVEVLVTGRRAMAPVFVTPTSVGFSQSPCISPPFDSVIVVTNTGAQPLNIAGLTLTGDGDFEQVPQVNLPVTLSPSQSLTIPIRFNPQSPGLRQAQLTVKIDAPSDTMVVVSLSGQYEILRLTSPRVDFGTITAGQLPSVRTLTVTNNGSLDVTIVGYRFATHNVFTLTTTLPVTIPVNESREFEVEWKAPSNDGRYEDTLILITQPNCDDHRVVVQGILKSPPGITIPGSVQFAAALCDEFLDTTIVIKNSGGETLEINGAQLSGDPDFSIAPSFVPFSIPPGGEGSIGVRFRPVSEGTKSVTLLLATNATPPTASILITAHKELVAVSSTPVDFGVVFPQQFPAERMLILQNTGTLPLTIRGVIVASPFYSTAVFPILLPPGMSVQIPIRFSDPSADGWSLRDLALIIEPELCEPHLQVVRGERGTASVILEAGVGHAAPGELVEIPIMVRNARYVSVAGVTGFRTSLRFNRTLLKPLTFGPGIIQGNDRIVEMTLPYIPGDGVLTTFRFIAALGSDTSTILQLENTASLGASISVTELPGLFTLDNVCREGGTRLIEATGTVYLRQNYPNPFNPVTTVEYETIETGPTRLVVFDKMGKEVSVLVDSEIEPGRYAVSFDASHLPGDVYYLFLFTPTQTRSRAMMLLK